VHNRSRSTSAFRSIAIGSRPLSGIGDTERANSFLYRAFELIERAALDMDLPTKRGIFMDLKCHS